MKWPEARTERQGMARSRLLQAAAVTAGGLLLDQGLGWARKRTMRQLPEVEVTVNPESDRAILIAGGLGNDGIAVGRAMRHQLLPLGSLVAIRYAQTNLDPRQLYAATNRAIEQHDLGGHTFDVYLNSAGGVIMGKPVERLSQELAMNSIVLDGSPASGRDVQGIQGQAVRWGIDRVSSSRLINTVGRLVAERQMPPATDKEPATPLEFAEAHRAAIVSTDSITTGVAAGHLRKHPVLPGSLENVAARTILFMSSETDPLVNPKTAHAGWCAAFGRDVEYVVDPHRPAFSHAAGPTYSLGVRMALERYAPEVLPPAA